MGIFKSEQEMQDWLSEELASVDGLAELIPEAEIEGLQSRKPTTVAEKKLLSSYQTCIDSLHINTPFTENENISVGDTESLKPDFILYAPETESFVIIELKNIANPTRQAGTELGAYIAELRSWIPYTADGDISGVIISVEWPALLKHYVRHEIFWQNKNILCLRPIKNGDGIELEMLPFNELCEDPFSFKMSDSHLGGYQICLYEYGRKEGGPSKLDTHIKEMELALKVMAMKGSSLNSHGFAFLWRDRWDKTMAPYSITLLNTAPLKSIERFIHLDTPPRQKIFDRFLTLIREYDPEGHSDSLNKICCVSDDFLGEHCNPRPEAFTCWGNLKPTMLRRGELLAFTAWGIFGDAFIDELKAEYKAGNPDCSISCPKVGLRAIETILDDSYDYINLTYMYEDAESEEDEPF